MQVPNVREGVRNNPNATASVTSGSLTGLVAIALSHLIGHPMQEWQVAVVVPAMTGLRLWVGRRGLLGVWHDVMHGRAG